MKTKNKFKSACLYTSAAAISISLINKLIFLSSDKNILPKNCLSYHWRFGTVSYSKCGKGTPLLLIHDLLPGDSAAEWKNVVRRFSASHTVYTLDLLGFGRSDKPAMTYTNYLYVQLIVDFVRDVIGKKTDVIATGTSANTAVLSCCSDKNLFRRLILVNPDSAEKAGQIPDRRTKLGKFIVETPVIGTLLYNIMVSKVILRKEMSHCYYENPAYYNRELHHAFHESAHLGGYSAKYIYSSIIGNYTNFSISHKIGEIENKFCILGGSKEISIQETIGHFKKLNPEVQSFCIAGSRHFPQIEKPETFFRLCEAFLAENII